MQAVKPSKAAESRQAAKIRRNDIFLAIRLYRASIEQMSENFTGLIDLMSVRLHRAVSAIPMPGKANNPAA
jgi:hypothetical protein